jgi:hypothetical protein
MSELATREMTGPATMALQASPIAPPAPRYSLDDMWTLAQNVAESGLFPGCKNPQQAFTLMMICESEGLHPMMALKRYHIIPSADGPRPSMRADAMQAEFQARGGVIELVRCDDEEARAIFSHPKHQPKPIERSVTFEQFRKSGVINGRDGIKKNWRESAADMLWSRLVTKNIRKIYPGIVAGIYSPEEIEDMEPTPQFAPGGPTPTASPVRAISPPADIEVVGYAGTGFDDRPYHRVAADAVEALNAKTLLAWRETLGPDGPRPDPVAVNDMHREILFAATNVGHYEGPKPARMTEALKALAGLYKSHRDWVREEIQGHLIAKAEASEEALAAALAKRRDPGDAAEGPGDAEDYGGETEGAGDDAREG